MDIKFYLACFVVGISVASAVGPIFVLTFNRSALYGLWRGLATALGAACGDGFLFFLGLLGVLQFLGEIRGTILIVDLIGGILLIGLGVRSFKGLQKYASVSQIEKMPMFVTVIRSFLITVANPLTVLFFMFVGVRILPCDDIILPFKKILVGSFFVVSGSLTMLSSVAFIASILGSSISKRRLVTVSHVTGVIFFGIGIYFFIDFFIRIFKMFYF